MEGERGKKEWREGGGGKLRIKDWGGSWIFKEPIEPSYQS